MAVIELSLPESKTWTLTASTTALILLEFSNNNAILISFFYKTLSLFDKTLKTMALSLKKRLIKSS